MQVKGAGRAEPFLYLENFSDISVPVIGDVILDEQYWS